MAILIISTGGLIYDGITNVIVSYLEAMDLTKLDIYVAGSLKIEPGIRKKIKDLGCRIVDLPDRRKDTITSSARFITSCSLVRRLWLHRKSTLS